MLSGFEFRDWLLANDPALSRLRLASRVTLTVVCSTAILVAFHFLVMPLPQAAYGLGIVLSVEGGVAVRDKGYSRQLVTRLLGCFTSLVVVGIAAGLEERRYLSDAIFLVVILLATSGRVFGPRGHAIGMFAFFSYFMGAYFHPKLEEMPLIALGPVVSAVTGQVVSVLMLPDNWRSDLLRSLESVQGRVNQILFKLAALASEGFAQESDRQELRQLEERLKEVVLMAESFIPRPPGGVFDGSAEPAAELAVRLFNLHLAAESAIVVALQKLPDFELVHVLIEGGESTQTDEMEDAEDDKAAVETRRALLWLGQAKRHLAETIEEARISGFAAIDTASEKPTTGAIDFSLRNPLIKSALQITLASAVAMSAGLMLSRERWFWAVLVSFLVFTNTNSRGDTAIKALQRSMGTLFGVIIGLGLATLLSGHAAIAIGVSVVCIFLAFYFLQISYATMTFFASIVLCLIYGLTGVLTLDLLLLRFQETLIGALAGTAVAFLVFPARTRGALDAALEKWYSTLDKLLAAALDGKARFELIPLSQELDAAYRDLTVAARPLGSSWSLVTRPGRIRQTLAIFLTATYWARLMAGTYTADISEDQDVRVSIADARSRLGTVSARGSECFFVERTAPASAGRHLPLSRGGARLAAEMIGGMLDRLYRQA